VLFGLDFIVRVVLADQRPRYILQHWLDVLIIALPLLRPLRLLRLASLLAVLNRHAASGLRGQVAVYVVGGSSLLAFCAALAVPDAERRNPAANISDFGDATWRAVTTMTVVGYGDRYPTTGPGRLVASALMVACLRGICRPHRLILVRQPGDSYRTRTGRRRHAHPRPGGPGIRLDYGAVERWTRSGTSAGREHGMENAEGCDAKSHLAPESAQAA
jgi:Ion channel